MTQKAEGPIAAWNLETVHALPYIGIFRLKCIIDLEAFMLQVPIAATRDTFQQAPDVVRKGKVRSLRRERDMVKRM